MTMKRLIKLILFAVPVLALTFAAALLGYLLAAQRESGAQRAYAANVTRPAIPTLQELTASADDDAEALDAITTYYAAHRDRIAAELDEDDETRLRALYAMHIIHISHVYDVVPTPAKTLLDYIRVQAASHCGTYARWQHVINGALGVESRVVELADGSHGLVEARINGAWEVFDATTNLWLSIPVETLVTGAPRLYRTFYTLLEDPAHAEAWGSYQRSGGWWDVLKLRRDMIDLGVTNHAGAELRYRSEW
jgi:hypothetical protein